MTYQETDNKLASLIQRRVGGTLVHWREVGNDQTQHEYIVLWRKIHPMSMGEHCAEFGVHRALLGVNGTPTKGLSDLISGDYYFDFDKAVKRFKSR